MFIKFQMFTYRFYTPFPPNKAWFRQKFSAEVNSHYANTVFEEFFKILKFSSKETKFIVLVYFWALFSPGK